MRRVGLAVLCLGLSSGIAVAADFPVGRWYTEGVENGAYAQFLIISSGSTFKKTIRDSTNCKSQKSWLETGTWQVRGTRYTTVTATVMGENVDTSDPGYNDAFEITKIDGMHVTMFDLKTRITWYLDAVSDNFQLPPPSHCGKPIA